MIAIDELYQEIADVLVEIVPERWSKVYVNAQVNGMNSKAFLYYYPVKEEQVVSGDDIPVKFKAYKMLYPQLLEELEITFSQLWFAVKEEDGEAFTNVTYLLTSDGEIDVIYSEEAVNEETFRQQWMEKYIK